jgi:hypothetical protein
LNGQSVPHEQRKFGGARVFLIPTLMVLGYAVRSVLESDGYSLMYYLKSRMSNIKQPEAAHKKH